MAFELRPVDDSVCAVEDEVQVVSGGGRDRGVAHEYQGVVDCVLELSDYASAVDYACGGEEHKQTVSDH